MKLLWKTESFFEWTTKLNTRRRRIFLDKKVKKLQKKVMKLLWKTEVAVV